jgi:hypothetical protein
MTAEGLIADRSENHFCCFFNYYQSGLLSLVMAAWWHGENRKADWFGHDCHLFFCSQRSEFSFREKRPAVR